MMAEKRSNRLEQKRRQKRKNKGLMKNKERIRLWRKRRQTKKGSSLMDKVIDKVPVELHIPGYHYCVPGTKLAKRLARQDKPVNKIDEFYQKHDKLYADLKDSEPRQQADKELAAEALKRANAKDASIGEKLAALGIAGVMTAEGKLEMGLKLGKYKRKSWGKLKANVKSKFEKEKQDYTYTKKDVFSHCRFQF